LSSIEEKKMQNNGLDELKRKQDKFEQLTQDN
jgi:hypothetical protein